MEERNTQKIIERLIQDLGGVARVSEDLSLHPLTILRWGYKGRIPKKYLKKFMTQSPGSDWEELSPLFKRLD